MASEKAAGGVDIETYVAWGRRALGIGLVLLHVFHAHPTGGDPQYVLSLSQARAKASGSCSQVPSKRRCPRLVASAKSVSRLEAKGAPAASSQAASFASSGEDKEPGPASRTRSHQRFVVSVTRGDSTFHSATSTGSGSSGKAGRFPTQDRVTTSRPGHQSPPKGSGIRIGPSADAFRPSSWFPRTKQVTVAPVAPNSSVARPAPSVRAAGSSSRCRPVTSRPCLSPASISPETTSKPSGTVYHAFQGACKAARTCPPPPRRPSRRAVASATSTRCLDRVKGDSLIPPQVSPAS